MLSSMATRNQFSKGRNPSGDNKDDGKKFHIGPQTFKGGSVLGSWKNGWDFEYAHSGTGSQQDAPLIFQEGDITADIYRSSKNIIVQICNCVAVRPHGLSQEMAHKYPYSNSYSTRRPIGSLNRADIEDRAEPGTIAVCRSERSSRDPVVVNMFGQFYMGKNVKSNRHSQLILSTTENQLESGNNHEQSSERYKKSSKSDEHLVNGLLKDTQENRIFWFQQCLRELAVVLPGMDSQRIIFPYKIGCGLAGGDWEKDYFPAIQKFVSDIAEYKIKVIILRRS
ncbi:uncharacterized protein [Palaemon carinicauda]|uniref:uncharacterized protein isoform X2 n=1 Tax=Palaemon carinicauda TaxID=392227 RepID=UPI0035B5FD37